LRRWTGLAWQENAPISPSSCGGGHFDVRVQPNATAVVASGGGQLNVLRQAGGGWTPISGPLNPTSGALKFDPSLALDAAGNPVVAWAESGAPNPLYVAKITGTDWRFLGGRALNVDPAQSVTWYSLALLPDGTPVVAWDESNTGSGFRIYVARWTGIAWSLLGGGRLSAEEGRSPKVVVGPAGTPFVAWLSSSPDVAGFQLRVSRWDGTAWSPLGGPLNVDAQPQYLGVPSLALGADGQPWVAWSEPVNGAYGVYLKHWSGSAWVQEAHAFNVEPSAHAMNPALAIDANGDPILAWDEGASDNFFEEHRIYVKRRSR
jgi:hypothetical protein